MQQLRILASKNLYYTLIDIEISGRSSNQKGEDTAKLMKDCMWVLLPTIINADIKSHRWNKINPNWDDELLTKVANKIVESRASGLSVEKTIIELLLIMNMGININGYTAEVSVDKSGKRFYPDWLEEELLNFDY